MSEGNGSVTNQAFLDDVLTGLSLSQKALPARWLYDDAGSEIFEQITQLPEYYPTRAETEILTAQADALAQLIGVGRAVVEFGSGSSVKTPLLLSAIAPAAYVPLDISGDFLRASAAALSDRFPGLPVHPLEADFMRAVDLPEAVKSLPKLGFFPGSTIGNMGAGEAVDLLRSMRETLGTNAQLLIGMDLIKDARILEAAYDDGAGVTAQFNLNLARRINRELDGTIPVDHLAHRAVWNDAHARVEMHLVAMQDLGFTIGGRAFSMAEGEWVHTENSHKYDARSLAVLLRAGGWEPRENWTDAKDQFSLVLADASAPHFAP